MVTNVRIIISGGPYPGREKQALQLLNEANQFYVQKKKEAEIEVHDFFVFDDFSAEIGGITVLRGDPDKLQKLDESEEAVSLGHRAQLMFRNLRMVKGFFGKNLQDRMANYIKQVELLK